MTDYPEIAARFARETAGHQMTVLHEDGLYRHLVFADPVPNFHRFDLITWPHGLLICVDGPTFAFALWPTEDLFDMFRGSSSGGINPGYWQEKVTAGEVKSWSEDMFRTWLVGEAAGYEAQHPGLVEAVGEQVLNSDQYSTEYRGTAEFALAQFRHGDFRLRFPDHWEVSFEDYSWEFLWACHAVLWGIRQYDATKAVPKAVAVAGAGFAQSQAAGYVEGVEEFGARIEAAS
ncbi:hypothetical protein [Streptomyces sp. NPDC096339]|uniref:hypothetical protein n=1 Tax=Streptomyces sp. NPDC096339 TaxID=3366086 RepID=UPI0037F6AFC0